MQGCALPVHRSAGAGVFGLGQSQAQDFQDSALGVFVLSESRCLLLVIFAYFLSDWYHIYVFEIINLFNNSYVLICCIDAHNWNKTCSDIYANVHLLTAIRV